MIAFDGLRVSGEIVISSDGLVKQADPLVVMHLDLFVDLAARGMLVTHKETDVRIGDQVSYRVVAWWSGCLILQRVEDNWIPRPVDQHTPAGRS